MYDFYIGNKVYHDLKDLVVDLYNGEDVDYTAEGLKSEIDTRYANNELSSSQYDNLMNYLIELM